MIQSFRPQTFSEVVGEEVNSRLLLSVAKNRGLGIGPSTYIFAGQFGSGKTTSSRLFSRALNCSNLKDDLCGKCEACTCNILEAPFYSEYDSSSMGNIDSIRELRDSFFFKVKGYTRVINLDECLAWNTRIYCKQNDVVDSLTISEIVKNKLSVSVLSYNFGNKIFEWKRVVGWHVNAPKPFKVHEFVRLSDGYVLTLTATDHHLVFKEDGREVEVSSLAYGNRVFSYFCGQGVLLEYRGVRDSNPSVEDINCYDITVEDNHNYLAEGVLVHNCHLLTRQAQSALLKVFEETSEGVYFVLSTTDPEKLLPTIRSRSLVLNYSIKSKDQIVKNLHELSDKYSLSLSDRVIDLIALRSRGHMRDAHMLIDKCRLLGEEDFIKTDLSAYNYFVKYVASIFLKDKNGLFSSIEQILKVPVSHSRDDWQLFLLDLVKVSVDSSRSVIPQLAKLSSLLGNRSTQFVRLAMSDWVIKSFNTDVQLQTCLLALYQIVTKEFN